MNEDPEAPRKAVWPPPRRTSHPPPPPPEQPFIPLAQRATCGLLDITLIPRWEAQLTGPELDRWKKLQALLSGASPDFEAALLNYIINHQLHRARSRQGEADQEGQRFRRDLIERNIPAYAHQIERLDVALWTSYQSIATLDQWLEGTRTATSKLEDALTAVQAQGLQLQIVADPWMGTWPGAAEGRGISGYDTPAGVEKVKKEVEAAVARKQRPVVKPEAPKAEATLKPKSGALL